MKIYTKTGDKGSTGLWGGGRVSKSSDRVDAYGNLDELVSWFGLTIELLLEEQRVDKVELQELVLNKTSLVEVLVRIQVDLFELGTELASVKAKLSSNAISDTFVQQLEQWIDASEACLPMLDSFVIPGGSVLSSNLHIMRTICRRVERSVVRIHHEEPVRHEVLQYLNRLSDLLFSLSRFVLTQRDIPEKKLTELRELYSGPK